jgi:hypothetical protein
MNLNIYVVRIGPPSSDTNESESSEVCLSSSLGKPHVQSHTEIVDFWDIINHLALTSKQSEYLY